LGPGCLTASHPLVRKGVAALAETAGGRKACLALQALRDGVSHGASPGPFNDCLAELHRKPALCRLTAVTREKQIPHPWNLSRFLDTLGQEPHRTALRAVFDALARCLGVAVPDLGRDTAGDATALTARAKADPRAVRAETRQGLPQPTGGKQEYHDDQTRPACPLPLTGQPPEVERTGLSSAPGRDASENQNAAGLPSVRKQTGRSTMSHLRLLAGGGRDASEKQTRPARSRCEADRPLTPRRLPVSGHLRQDASETHSAKHGRSAVVQQTGRSPMKEIHLQHCPVPVGGVASENSKAKAAGLPISR
jgi:hypothetical protein